MRTNQQEDFPKSSIPHHWAINKVVTAFVLIIAGLMFLGRNLGLLDPYLFNIVISWQMLVIVIGITSILKRHYWGGLFAIVIGTSFLLPKIIDCSSNQINMFWPVLLVMFGLMILLKPKPRLEHRRFLNNRKNDYFRDTCNSADGYVMTENTFSSIRQIVLDPIFKGANLKNNFGGIMLDLRRTKLETPETVIEVDCNFGGIEIYMPAHWNLQPQVSCMLGGCDDKRYNSGIEIDREHVLIVRGNITFGGLEFKS